MKLSDTAGSKNPRARLTPEQVAKIREDPRPQKIIADEYGVSQMQISRIKRRKAWRR